MDRPTLSSLQHGVIGSLAGVTEVLMQQWTVSVKNQLQQNVPKLDWRPSVLYRGVTVNAATIAPITATQFAVNGALTNIVRGGKDRQLTSMEKLGIGFSAGATGSLLAGPAELIMIHQQIYGGTITSTAAKSIQTFGVPRLFTGLGMTALRDGSWCLGYLALRDVVKDGLHRTAPAVFGSERSESSSSKQIAMTDTCGSIAVGILVCLLTQPMDTIKTVVQSKAATESLHPSSLGATRDIFHRGGLRAFYGGFIPRAFRLSAGVFILGFCRDALEKRFAEHQLLAF